jgi:Stage II sporulation protein E (SpoIIE)/GAF domain
VPVARAVREAKPILLPADDDWRAQAPPDAAVEAVRNRLGMTVFWPVTDDAGLVIAAVGVSWDQGRRLDDLTLASLDTVGELCGLTLERARLADAIRRDAVSSRLLAAHTGALAALAGHLSVAHGFDEVGAAIAEYAGPALGADFAIVGVTEGDRFSMLAPSGPHLDRLTHYRDLSLDDDFPALLALRRREVVTFSALDAVPDTQVADDLAAMGLHGGACAPLLAADGEALGVLVALWSHPPRFDPALLGRIVTVGDLCAQSAERARLFDAEHRIRRDLQARVLPTMPTVPGVEVAARYQPAAQSVGMGGDWYDGIALEGNRLCLVIGDVSGHGLGAVAEMTQIRTVVHTLAAGGMDLPEILVRTSTEMQRDARGYATVLVAVIDCAAGEVSYVTAGHPPPLLRLADGTVHTLTGGRHSVLGVDLAPHPTGRAAFTPGSTLIVYTDGLIERRGTTIDRSIAGLAQQVGETDVFSIDALADDLLERNRAGAGRTDDVALVVAQRYR